MKQQARNFSTEIKQIDLDVNRTFRNHIMFMDRFGVKWVLSVTQHEAVSVHLETLLVQCVDFLIPSFRLLHHCHPKESWAKAQLVIMWVMWILLWPLKWHISVSFHNKYPQSLLFHMVSLKFLFLFSVTPHMFRVTLSEALAGCDLWLKPWISPFPPTHTHILKHTHTKPKRLFPLLSVLLAFLSVHEAPQEMAFIQKCAPASSVHAQNNTAHSVILSRDNTYI